MRLFVRVIEARGLSPVDSNGLCDSYVKVQLGKHSSKTKVVKKSSNPFWDEVFDFKVGDLGEEVRVYVLNDEKCLGCVKISLSLVFETDNFSLGTAWYQLSPKSKKQKNRVCGEILLAVGFPQKKLMNDEISTHWQNSPDDLTSGSDRSIEIGREQFSSFSIYKVDSYADYSISGAEETELVNEDKSSVASFDIVTRHALGRKSEDFVHTNEDMCSLESQNTIMKPNLSKNHDDKFHVDATFDELLKSMQSNDHGCEMPEILSGGVLIDQAYVTTPWNLNSLLFSPVSEFAQSMAELNGTADLKIEAWKLESGESNVKRLLTYTKAANKLVKALRAKEEQIYLKADGKYFSVLAIVSIPDVPFGSKFKTEILYNITPGPELPSDEQSAHLLISWRINFTQSTMMKSLIENGAKQGLTESFGLFAETLSKNVKQLEIEGLASNKEQILASLQTEQESFWKLLSQFYGNFTVIFFVIVALCVLIHMLIARRSMVHGLEFIGLDLPDTIGEVLVCVALVVQGQLIMSMTKRFFCALKLRGGNQGVKLQEDGWILTVALIEGTSLTALGSSELSDPYVVFTCNGQKRTSSIRIQTLNPLWNEVLVFDAMCDPPSRMDVVVNNFGGPFDEATALGHAEVNFLKSNLSYLSDVWVTLHGNSDQACQSKLRLKIFLNNSKGNEVAMEYLTKMAKDVGKKINLRSPQTNSSFQKMFGLPPEEFLIDDFTCHLKRKMPLQGRLFLSRRIIGFYANLFGNKTKFFFLWDDIEDIQVIPPSLASVGSPSLLITLHKCRGNDAKHGAKGIDQKGRLKFHFQSFVSFNAANRTIMALWKTRTPNLEQQVQTDEIESKVEPLQLHDNESISGMDEMKMSEAFSSSLSISANLLMEAFEGGSLEHKIVEKIGKLDYSVTPWEEVKPKVCQRQISYRFDKRKFSYDGVVSSTQKKYPLLDGNGWLIEETMSLNGVLLGDCFNLQLKYQVENVPSKPLACNVQVSFGIIWLKRTKHQKRIIKTITSNSCLRLKEMFRLVEKELLQEKYDSSTTKN